MKLSIIIPVFNKYKFTISALKSLSKLSINNHEIIVIDNGSTDETEEQIKLLNLPNLIYFKHENNLGFSAACNKGYSLSTCDNILFLNNDIKVLSNFENWTQNIFDNLEENTLIGPTGGLIDVKNNFQFVYETNDSLKTINYMSGWCLAATKNTFDKLIEKNEIGPFNTKFFAFYEDTHLSFMAKKMSIKFKLIT